MRGACTTVLKILRLKGDGYLHDAVKVLACDVFEIEGITDNTDKRLIDADAEICSLLEYNRVQDSKIEVLEESIANLINRMDK